MTEQEIIEGNELIAEFDGWELVLEIKDPKCITEPYRKYKKPNGNIIEGTNCLRYNEDWNQLIPICNKLYKIQSGNDFMKSDQLKYLVDSISFISDNGIEEIYKVVIYCIKRYNKWKSSQ